MLSRSCRLKSLVASSALFVATVSTVEAKPMEWSEIAALPQPAADATVAYGKDKSQFGELRLPKSKGPFKVVVFLHGGCWESAYSLDHVRNLVAAITDLGYATWSVEYRRLGETGGGWPGTFRDVGDGVDYLRVLAKKYPLDLKHVTIAGHSAGGHLALWAAGRASLPAASALAQKDPLPIHAVVGLAAISDIKAYSVGQGSCNASAPRLMGGAAAKEPERYKEALPVLPARMPVYMVHGSDDAIVPVDMSRLYVSERTKAHHPGKLFEIYGAGHFDVIAKTSPAWKGFKEALLAASE